MQPSRRFAGQHHKTLSSQGLFSNYNNYYRNSNSNDILLHFSSHQTSTTTSTTKTERSMSGLFGKSSRESKTSSSSSLTRSFTTTTSPSGAGGILPPVSSRSTGMSNLRKSAMSTHQHDKNSNTYVSRSKRQQQSGGGSFTYTSARLNAVRNSTMSKNCIVPPQLPGDRGKLTVVLDVDETLIHSRLSSQQDHYRQAEERKEASSSCEEFKITLEDGETVWVNKRPGLDEFLRHMGENYETFVYTAGLEEYAKPLLDWLDPNGTIFRHRFYRDSCLFMRGYYVKDLQKFNRDLTRTVLVDNNAFCFLPQLSNGIPISSFYDDPNDTALSVLASFLKRLDEEKDVRPFLRKSFNLETLLKDHRDQIIG